jgi:hypothetical protein
LGLKLVSWCSIEILVFFGVREVAKVDHRAAMKGGRLLRGAEGSKSGEVFKVWSWCLGVGAAQIYTKGFKVGSKPFATNLKFGLGSKLVLALLF